MQTWKLGKSFHYGFNPPCPNELQAAMQKALPFLFGTVGYVCAEPDENVDIRCLKWLQEQGYARKQGGTQRWKLTDIGMTGITKDNVLLEAEDFLKPRKNVKLAEQETMELIIQLETEGFKFQVRGERVDGKGVAAAYTLGGEKIYWLRNSTKHFSRMYALALLLAPKHKQTVEPFRTAAYYLSVIERREHKPKAKTCSGFKFDMDEDTAKEPAKPKKVGVKRKHASSAGSGESDGSEESVSDVSPDRKSSVEASSDAPSSPSPKPSASSAPSSSSESSASSSESKPKAVAPKKPGPHGGDWDTWELPSGARLILNPYTAMLSAHCHVHGKECKVMKSMRKHPLGFLIEWTQWVDHNDGNSRAHRDYVELLRAPGTWQRRKKARKKALGIPALEDLFEREHHFSGSHSTKERETL